MKVALDKEKCTICFSCVAICPEVFEGKDDGTVDVKDEYTKFMRTTKYLLS